MGELIHAEIKLIHKNAKVPTKSRSTDAGWDVYSIEDVIINPMTACTVNTGVCIAVPPGYYFTTEGRSGLLFRDIIPANGTIDATYTGELRIRILNVNNEPYTINQGDRVAQIIFKKVYDVSFIEVNEFSSEYVGRGTAGFGSSGR